MKKRIKTGPLMLILLILLLTLAYTNEKRGYINLLPTGVLEYEYIYSEIHGKPYLVIDAYYENNRKVRYWIDNIGENKENPFIAGSITHKSSDYKRDVVSMMEKINLYPDTEDIKLILSSGLSFDKYEKDNYYYVFTLSGHTGSFCVYISFYDERIYIMADNGEIIYTDDVKYKMKYNEYDEFLAEEF